MEGDEGGFADGESVEGDDGGFGDGEPICKYILFIFTEVLILKIKNTGKIQKNVIFWYFYKMKILKIFKN